MRISEMCFAVTLLISLSFTGVAAWSDDSNGMPKPAPADLKPPVSVDQFKADLPATNQELHLQGFLDLKKQGPVVVLDIRSKESFDRWHIKGSVNEPLSELTEKTLPKLAPDKSTPVVLACDFSFQPTRMVAGTLQAYPVLKASGYTKIYRLNLWDADDHKKVLEPWDEEKLIDFAGTDVKPAADTKKP